MSISYLYESTSGMTKVVDMTPIRDLEPEDLEGYFYIHITNGYIVRSLIHMLRDVMLYAILELTPNRVRILRYDNTGKLIVHLELLTSKFTSYFFLSQRNVIKIGIDFSHLWHKMKILRKPDPFIAFKRDGDEFITLDFGSMARHHYPLQGVVDQEIHLPEYTNPCHNINISVRELSTAMTALRTNKTKITFKGYRDKLIIETPKQQTFQSLGTSCDEFWKKIEKLSKSDVIERLSSENPPTCSLHLNEDNTALRELPDDAVGDTDEPIVSMEQPHTFIKSLAKVYNISDNSPIRVTTEENKPIKLSLSICQYGVLTFYMFKDTILS